MKYNKKQFNKSNKNNILRKVKNDSLLKSSYNNTYQHKLIIKFKDINKYGKYISSNKTIVDRFSQLN